MPGKKLHKTVFEFALFLPLAGAATAIACLTPDSAARLGIEHPDAEFVKAALHAHEPNPIPYTLRAPFACTNGMADRFECLNVDLVGHIPLNLIGAGSGSDSWGWTDPLDQREYAIVGRSNGVAFIDVSDPGNIVYLGNLPRPAGVAATVWSDIKVYRDHAFMVADNAPGHGLLVFDLTRLRNVVNPPVEFTHDAHFLGFQEAHNIAINIETGFAYAVGGEQCNGGLNMIDIRQPKTPVSAGCFSQDGYTHDVQCVVYRGPDVEHRDREICFASNQDTLTIVDVSDKSKPVQLSRTPYAQVGFTHQGWLTADQRYFVMDDETDETSFGFNTRTITMNVADLDAPTVAGFHFADGQAIDHNQYVLGDYTFQANYQRGLRILRLDDPASGALSEVAFFDTWPAGNMNGFSGAWNVYPFFPSGNILISDFNRGFFLVRPNMEQIDTLFRDGFE